MIPFTNVACDPNEHIAKLDDIKLIDQSPNSVLKTNEEYKNSALILERLDSNMLTCPCESASDQTFSHHKNELICFDRFCESLFDQNRLKSPKKAQLSKTRIEKLERLIFGPPALKSELKPCRDLIDDIAATSFNNNDPNHQLTLKTIYIRLTNSSVYHRFGSHWQSIGFQGNDPVTDLRGCGILSLLFLLYAVEPGTVHSNLIQEIYKLSQNETQHFPFCLVVINLTGFVVESIRQGHLNPCLNRIKFKQGTNLHEFEFLSVCGKFLVALLLEFYLDWKNNARSIENSGVVLKEIEISVKKNSRYLIKKLDAYINGDEINESCSRNKKKRQKKDKDAYMLEFSILE